MLGDLLLFQNHLIIKSTVKFGGKKKKKLTASAREWCRTGTAGTPLLWTEWHWKCGVALAHVMRYLAPFQSVLFISHFHECCNYIGCHLKVSVCQDLSLSSFWNTRTLQETTAVTLWCLLTNTGFEMAPTVKEALTTFYNYTSGK